MNYYKKHDHGNSRNQRGRRGGEYFRDKVSFEAVCAECGKNCTVPFKPNGRKPVLCSNCFGGNDARKSDRFDFRDRKPSKQSYDRPLPGKRSDDAGLRDEMKQIKRKLDRILQILEEVTVEEIDE